MIARSFLKLCRIKTLMPNMFHVEALQDFMKSTIPPLTGDEFLFFENNEIMLEYEKDKNFETTPVEPLETEPGLLFHEFVLLIGRICATCKNT